MFIYQQIVRMCISIIYICLFIAVAVVVAVELWIQSVFYVITSIFGLDKPVDRQPCKSTVFTGYQILNLLSIFCKHEMYNLYTANASGGLGLCPKDPQGASPLDPCIYALGYSL